MPQRFWVILILSGLISGCAASQQPPKFEFPADTRVGIINHLEAFATHQNYQAIRVGNFIEKREVDWGMPAYVQDQVTRVLRNDSRYTIMPQKLTGSWNESEMMNRITRPDQVDPEFARLLDTLAGQNDLDVIIWIKSYKGPSPFKIVKHPIVLQGYGLFTRQKFVGSTAYVYANIEVIIFKTHPIAFIGSGAPNIKASNFEDIQLGDDLKNLPQSEFDKILPLVKTYAGEAVDQALKNANLL